MDCARCDEPLHVFAGIKLGEELLVPSGMCMSMTARRQVFEPARIADAVRLGASGGRGEEAGVRQRAQRGYAGGRASEKILRETGRRGRPDFEASQAVA
jgi:hypothetical protein